MSFATSTFRQAEATSTDREVERALRVVYERFGGDLRAFFQHVRELQEKERAKAKANRIDLDTPSSDASDKPAA